MARISNTTRHGIPLSVVRFLQMSEITIGDLACIRFFSIFWLRDGSVVSKVGQVERTSRMISPFC